MEMIPVVVCLMLASFVAGTTEVTNRTNWAGNLVYSADRLLEATSLQSLRALVRSEPKLTALGTCHCFNTIADNRRSQISLLQMHDVITLDASARTVTVAAGVTYAQLAPYLHARGFALHNLASLPDISVAGSISTATHGSGVGNGNLATAVAGLELVTAGGDIKRFSRKELHGVVVGLGALGVFSSVTLDVQPTFTVRQYVYENLPLAQAVFHFEEIMASGYSVSLFTDWQKQRFTQVWVKSRDGDSFAAPETFYGATRATRNMHPVGLAADNCTQQLGVPGPWYDRLPHFRAGVTASVGHELQSEYFVSRRDAMAAILALESSLRDEIYPLLFVTEIRVVAADALWLSTAFRRDSVAIHFTWKPQFAEVRSLLPRIELVLAPFHPRPHWGKVFTMAPQELQSRYIMLPKFRLLAAKLDPGGKFRNQFLATNVFTDT